MQSNPPKNNKNEENILDFDPDNEGNFDEEEEFEDFEYEEGMNDERKFNFSFLNSDTSCISYISAKKKPKGKEEDPKDVNPKDKKIENPGTNFQPINQANNQYLNSAQAQLALGTPLQQQMDINYQINNQINIQNKLTQEIINLNRGIVSSQVAANYFNSNKIKKKKKKADNEKRFNSLNELLQFLSKN